tara:strand:- start:664 stop:1608 length:945 start_codon:yes stop_codon:yes gene_type:complete
MKFKKPKFWDLKKPNFLSFLLLPFTIPIKLNNFFLNRKSKAKIEKIKTICVGNIYVGGTGKTPITIELYNILKELKLRVCVGKKFYPKHSDESMLLQKKTELICLENRKNIIRAAIDKNYDFLIFDDGLQDKSISYNLEIVCFDTQSWIGNGNLLPAGPLREKISSIKKYDAIFLKSSKDQHIYIKDIIKKINPKIKIFETSYEISNIENFNLSDNYLIFSGIGNPKSFKKMLIENEFNIVDEIIFPDHYDYKKRDINLIKLRAKKLNAKIITTEKDFLKTSLIENNDIEVIKINLKLKNRKELINFLNTNIHE